LRMHGLGDDYIRSRVQGLTVSARDTEAWRSLMQTQVSQARNLLVTGAPLAWRLPGRIGLELRLVVHGGLRILERLDQVGYDMFNHRPTLKTTDRLLLICRGLSGPKSLYRFSSIHHS